jgi:hypothetical protein
MRPKKGAMISSGSQTEEATRGRRKALRSVVDHGQRKWQSLKKGATTSSVSQTGSDMRLKKVDHEETHEFFSSPATFG